MGEVTRGLEGFAEEAEGQAQFFEARAPVYARVVREAIALAGTDAATRAHLLDAWGERIFHARYDRPLLLCAAIHQEVQRDPSHPLATALREADPSAVTREAVAAALASAPTLHTMRTRFVQTNEVSRAIAWRLPMAKLPAGAQVVLVDLGCSAALNLVADGLPLSWTSADGRPLDLPLRPIVERVGLDRAPIDPRDEAAARWLRACIWPGDHARRARLDAALARASSAVAAGELQTYALDAAEMPGRVESITCARARDTFVVAYQTVMADYLLPETRFAYEAGMRDWVLRHPGRALWVELERAPKGSPGPAELRVHLAVPASPGVPAAPAAPGTPRTPEKSTVRTLVLGSCEYHPGAIALRDDALLDLTAALGSHA